ncbi:uncharacterized protein LOC143927074 [Lithobates pipiens]
MDRRNSQIEEELQLKRAQVEAIRADRAKIQEARRRRQEEVDRIAVELRELKKRWKEELARERERQLLANKEKVAAMREMKLKGKMLTAQERRKRLMELDMKWKEEERLRAEFSAKDKEWKLEEERKKEELRQKQYEIRRASDLRFIERSQTGELLVGFNYFQRRGNLKNKGVEGEEEATYSQASIATESCASDESVPGEEMKQMLEEETQEREEEIMEIGGEETQEREEEMWEVETQEIEEETARNLNCACSGESSVEIILDIYFEQDTFISVESFFIVGFGFHLDFIQADLIGK